MNLTFVCRSLLATIAVAAVASYRSTLDARKLRMKTLFHRGLKALAFLVLAAGLAAQADAQLVKYQFTGTKTNGFGDVGTTISGTVTLDVGATPDYFNPINNTVNYGPDFYGHFTGYTQIWFNGGFSIDAVTNSGLAGGTSLGGETVFVDFEYDRLIHYGGHDYIYPTSGSYIKQIKNDATSEGFVLVDGTDNDFGNGGLGVVPNPWDPSGTLSRLIIISNLNYFTGVRQYGEFSIDSFTLAPPTIIIDGIDTGINNSKYQGRLVSQHLADCAAAAKNHGDYVSCVAKLTNALMKAGLLTGNQKGIIMDAAAKSSYGK